MKTNNTHRLSVNKVLGAALLALGLSASLNPTAGPFENPGAGKLMLRVW